ncbi:peptide/nickel transport system ATP-binding protein [Conyzicola lurida]|uniref:Peptide/nickel transport system ATP-binding protein n=1 Tax=Conyzicola lurida TaxID=1172621 RepID=A0A841ALI1_9MICO|nr:ABC transporter ATP-binding protein [Conyzicola lurida]MBB5842822.1 peptide/nickel transport system ATP-binding protein [Conyzicola lurida]
MSNRELVRVENLSVSFGGVPVVHDVSFSVHAGECVAIVGESGSGKSVTARTLVGLTGANSTVTADALRIDGRDALGLTTREWRRLRGGFAGLVLQDALVSLDPLRSIGAEIREVLRTHHVVPRRAETDRAIELLASVGVPQPELRVTQYAHQLSGGLRQRALIASALAADPALVIADEPTTALDVTVQKQIIGLLGARLDDGKGVLLISHDLAVVADIADRVIVMKNGRVVEEGTTDAVLGSPREAYTRTLLAAIPSASSRGTYLSRAASGTATTAERVPLPARAVDAGRVILSASGLHKTFTSAKRGSELHAVDDVSFELARGEVLGIVGESGSGKSTVANIVLGLTKPDAGEVRLDGEPWSALTEGQRRPVRSRLQFISQDPLSSFDPRWTVERVIAESTISLGLERGEARERAAWLLERVGLDTALLGRHPRTLSGGQRQRVSIARALAPEPEIIVCDEPASALDVSVQAQVLDLLAEIQADRGTSLLFVSHDLGVVHHVSDRVLVLKDGRVVESGPVDDVFYRPRADYTKQLLASLPQAVSAA